MKRIMAVLMIAVLLIASGCSNNDQSANGESTGTNETTSKSTSTNKKESNDGTVLNYWRWSMNPEMGISLGDSPLYKALQEETGVSIKFSEYMEGQEKEQFNLLVASGDLPDIVEYNFARNYVGGPEKAISDGVIIELTDLIPEYAPNFHKFLQDNPDVEKMIKTDDGKIYSFPFVRGDDRLMTYFGPVVNKALLDEFGLDIPQTMDDWYNMLTVFKNKGIETPLTYQSWMIDTNTGSPFIGAYGIDKNFYIDNDGNVQYGSIQPGYKDFLTEFNKWYTEGLLDADIATIDKTQVVAKVTSRRSGASLGYNASRLGAWITATKDMEGYDFVGVPFPSLNEGEKAEFVQIDFPAFGQGTSITSSCENVELAMKLLDYGYSQEGHMLYNFGVEGESYEMLDGYPQLTDLIVNNPDHSSAAMSTIYMRSSQSGPMVQDMRFYEQYGFTYKAQSDAVDTWSDVGGSIDHRLPAVTPTPEESEELTALLSEITTYRDEMYLKFLFGTESLDNYDQYVENINKMGIQRVLEIYTQALERYNNR